MHVPSYYSPIASIEQSAMNENVSEDQVLAALKKGEKTEEKTSETVYIPGISRVIADQVGATRINALLDQQLKRAIKSKQ